MNKAFVNEDSAAGFDAIPDASALDAALDQELFGSSSGGTPKNYITKQGFIELQESLRKLLQEERPLLAEIVSGPDSQDPQSESFQEAKGRLEDMDRRVRQLQRRIDLAEVIEPENQTGDQVRFGATVTVLDENEQTRVYKIVGIDETDGKNGKVSWVSPIGRALLQSQVGDAVYFKTPHGDEELEILKIEYKAIN